VKNIYLSPSDVIGSGLIKVDEVRKTVCPRNCFDTCGLLAYVKDGKLLKIEGDPDHPITNKGPSLRQGHAIRAQNQP